MSNLKSYEYVIAIAQKGGISQAAEALSLAQPTLSKYIKKLEEDLGVELLDRSTIPIRLTEAGACYVETGRRLIDLQHQLQKQLEEIKSSKSTCIRVGISPSRSPYLMPFIVDAYRKINPNAKIIIKERNIAELNQMLARGDLDLIISLLDEESQAFERMDLFEEDLTVALPQTLWYEGITALDALKSTTLISVGQGLTLWQTMHEILKTLGIHAPDIECQSIESALSLVRRGIGATILPSYVFQYGAGEQNRSICFLPLPTEQYPQWEKTYRRQVCLFYRKEQFLTEAERQFIACVRQEVQKKQANA